MDNYDRKIRLVRHILLWLFMLMFCLSDSINEKINVIMMFLLFSELCSIDDK